MLLLVPQSFRLPTPGRGIQGACGRGTWLRFQSGLETGSSSPSKLWSLEKAAAWVPAGAQLTFSIPSANALDLMMMMERKGSTQEPGSLGLVMSWSRKVSRGGLPGGLECWVQNTHSSSSL